MRGRRGHEVVGVLREEARDDGGLLRLAGDDGRFAGRAGLERFVAHVEAELALACLVVEAVALETRVRHDGPDVPVEVHRGGFGAEHSGPGGRRGKQQRDEKQHGVMGLQRHKRCV